jgi:cobalt-zinc-cadmium efflux system outer membrane protein
VASWLPASLCACLAGCATTAPERGTPDIEQAIAERGLPAPTWSAPADAPAAEAIGREPITLPRAVMLAFERNAGVRELYAELGIAQAEVLEAARLGNPRFDYARLRGEGGATQITRGFAIGFTDLLMLPVRSRLAHGAFAAARSRVAASLIDLAAEVEVAWYSHVNARQIAELRSMVAKAADASAEFAQRLHAAGNITPRNLALELATATEARIAAARAGVDAARARGELANLLGLDTAADWQTPRELPAVPAARDALADLEARALANRLDVTATRQEVELGEKSLDFVRRWWWLGVIEVGYQRETETDGERLKGPIIGWELPLFGWSRSGVHRQAAQLDAARARLAALELAVRNEVTLGANELTTAREVVESYRTALLPQREAVLGRTFEEFNYMLTDAFDLLQARQEQFQVYEEYLESVRDFWIARARLRRLVGGSLPGEDAPPGETIGVDSLLAPPADSAEPPANPSQHHGHTP